VRLLRSGVPRLLAAASVLATGLVAACGSFGSGDGVSSATDASTEVGDAGDASTGDAASGCRALVDEHFGAFPAPGFANTSDNQSAPSSSTVNVKSAPSSLAAVVVTPASGGAGATIERTFPLDGGLASGRLELDYDVFLEPSTTAYAEVGCTAELWNASDVSTRVLFARNPDGSLEVKSDNLFSAARPRADLAPSSGGWQHVHLVVESTAATAARATLAVVPASAGSAPPSIDIPVVADVDRVRILCGIDYASGESVLDAAAVPGVTVSVWVDDVVLTRCAP
jgi:hypothetical protein